METFEEYEARTAGLKTIGEWETETGCAPLPATWVPAYEGDQGWDTPRPIPEDLPSAAGTDPEPCLDSLGRPIPWMGD